MDFMRGAAMSKGGKPIVALPSITHDGKSRISAILQPGSFLSFFAPPFPVPPCFFAPPSPYRACLFLVSHPSGAGVVSTRAHVHYIVTEYGVAEMFGRSYRQRAKNLIDIAHPSHREELERAAVERFGPL